MTIGIYKLTFQSLESFPYIGQSINIEERYKKHLSDIKTGKCNIKIKQAYEIASTLPTISIIEECRTEQLNGLEEFYISKFNSVNSGLNINSFAYPLGFGELNGNSKYSNEQVLDALSYLVLDIPISRIANILDIPKDSLEMVARGLSHTWLKEASPEQYAVLMQKRTDRKGAKAQGIIYPQVVSPTGDIYTVENVRQFCLQHGLQQSNFNKVLLKRPRYKSHKGWKLVE